MNETKKEFRISDLVKKFIDDKDTAFFQFIHDGITTYPSKNKKAKATISLPDYICGTNTKDIRDWSIVCVAIPKEKIIKLHEELKNEMENTNH